MLRHRFLPALTIGVVYLVITASTPSLRTASAQGIKAPDEPIRDIDLESLLKEATPKGIEKIFDNGNIDAVQNQPMRATVFTLSGPARIAKITTYHWNNGRGAPAGTIALRSGSGETFGPWQATGQPGQGGVPDAYWVADPNVSLSAGTYTVVDSNPSTWAQNGATGGAGIAVVATYAE